jgi:hypothetical protein
MARGGFILLLVICFAAYWGWQYYKSVLNAREKDKYNKNPSDFKDTASDPDALEEYYKRKIVEMEEATVKGMTDAQEKLEYYKQQLTKLNNLKSK